MSSLSVVLWCNLSTNRSRLYDDNEVTRLLKFQLSILKPQIQNQTVINLVISYCTFFVRYSLLSYRKILLFSCIFGLLCSLIIDQCTLFSVNISESFKEYRLEKWPGDEENKMCCLYLKKRKFWPYGQRQSLLIKQANIFSGLIKHRKIPFLHSPFKVFHGTIGWFLISS